MTGSMTLRIVVADPLPVFREGLKRILERNGHRRMVGEASHPAQAIDLVRRLDPDVLVLTIERGQTGLDVMQSLVDLQSRVRCILLTSRDESPADLAAASFSVGCVLPRTSSGSDLLHCVECVLRHQCWPVRQSRADRAPAPTQPDHGASSRGGRYGLTRRETQIVTAVANGATNKDIAAQLAIAEDTVKHHMSNIFDKVGVHSRLELAVFALFHKVVDTDDSLSG